MRDRTVNIMGIIAFVSLLAAGCASDEMKSSSSPSDMGSASGSGAAAGSTGGSVPSSTKNIDRLAAGSVEDSLDACMARIPKDASAGQRMLAEESCRRDQAARR